MRSLLFLTLLLASLSLTAHAAGLVDALKFADKAELSSHPEFLKTCQPPVSANSACDYLLYHATILEKHFVYGFTRESDVDYINTFSKKHRVPTAQCLKAGFWNCFYFNLDSAIRYYTLLNLDCRKDTAFITQRLNGLKNELNLFLKTCTNQNTLNVCHQGEAAELLKAVEEPIKNRKKLEIKKSGFWFEHLGDDWVLKSSCEQEQYEKALAKKRMEYQSRGYTGECFRVGAECSPQFSPATKQILHLSDELQEFEAIKPEELISQIEDSLKNYPRRENLEANQKRYIEALEKNKKYLKKNAIHLLKNNSYLKGETPNDHLERLTQLFMKAVASEIEKKKKPAQDFIPAVVQKKIKTKKFVEPELSQSELQAIENTVMPKAADVEAKAETRLKHSLNNPKLKTNFGDLILDYEVTHYFKNYSLTDYHESLKKYRTLIKQMKAYEKFLRNEGLEEEEITNKILEKLNSDFTQNYTTENETLVESLNLKKGSCISRTKLSWSVLAELDLKWPEGWKPGIEVFKGDSSKKLAGHVQPVLLSPSKDNVKLLVTGEVAPKRGVIYKNELLLLAMVPEENKDNYALTEFLVDSKDKESLQQALHTDQGGGLDGSEAGKFFSVAVSNTVFSQAPPLKNAVDKYNSIFNPIEDTAIQILEESYRNIFEDKDASALILEMEKNPENFIKDPKKLSDLENTLSRIYENKQNLKQATNVKIYQKFGRIEKAQRINARIDQIQNQARVFTQAIVRSPAFLANLENIPIGTYLDQNSGWYKFLNSTGSNEKSKKPIDPAIDFLPRFSDPNILGYKIASSRKFRNQKSPESATNEEIEFSKPDFEEQLKTHSAADTSAQNNPPEKSKYRISLSKWLKLTNLFSNLHYCGEGWAWSSASLSCVQFSEDGSGTIARSKALPNKFNSRKRINKELIADITAYLRALQSKQKISKEEQETLSEIDTFFKSSIWNEHGLQAIDGIATSSATIEIDRNRKVSPEVNTAILEYAKTQNKFFNEQVQEEQVPFLTKSLKFNKYIEVTNQILKNLLEPDKKGNDFDP